MKLSVFAVLLGGMPFAEAAKYIKDAGCTAIEIGCGGYPGKSHCDPAVLLGDPAKLDEFKGVLKDTGLELAALSVHGNPIHPQKAIAKTFHDDFINAVLLAEKLGINRIVTFSGCPGDSEGSMYPNWVTCPWPDDFGEILKYQWDEVMIPYWKETAAFAKSHGVTKIALEMHPGFCVYNPETLMRLREAVGPEIGANFDPSHLFWQGIDPAAAIRYLGGDAIHYFHAKDTKVDEINTAKIGVLDTKHYGDEINRAWIFRSVGYGHDYQLWKDMMSNLRMVGYDDVISIEHEDSLMTSKEGLRKAIAFLKDVMMFEEKGGMFWA